MNRVGFKMKLTSAKHIAEYKKRHDEIWPELVVLLKGTGISDYNIFLDRDSLTLFAQFKITELNADKKLASEAIMKKWWAYMADLMETNIDMSPVAEPLEEMFYMP
jgi:L-rhamnose mutarotase